MNPRVLIDLRGRALSITTKTAMESISTDATLGSSSSKLKPLHHGNTPCQSCDDFYSSVSANLSIVHSPSDGTPGSRQIRTGALADAVAGLHNLLKLSSNGCRPGGDIGMVSLSLLQDVYTKHLQNPDAQRTQRNLRRSAYDLRPIFNHLFDPALTLISIGHRRGWGYDLSLKPGSLVEHHLQINGFTVDTLFATQSLSDLVFTYRNLEYYHRDSYKLSIHDLPLIKTLSELSEVEIGLDKHPEWLTCTTVNGSQTAFRLQILGALGWTEGFTKSQLMTLTVLLPEWEGTTRELLNSARLL